MRPEAERQIRGRLPGMRLPWCVAVACTLLLAGLGTVAGDGLLPPGVGEGTLLPRGLAAGGIIVGAGVVLAARRLLAPAALASRLPYADPELALRQVLAAQLALWSLALLPALLGLAQIFLGGDPRTHLALCGLSLVVLAGLMPTYSRLAALLRNTGLFTANS